MNKKINPRKQELIKLSKIARQQLDNNQDLVNALGSDATINMAVKHLFYPPGDYKTFKEWKELGYSLKGQKGYPIWGRKRKMKRKDETTGDESEYKAFPLAYIFHESQATKIEDAEQKAA